jgi:hypothetical protein
MRRHATSALFLFCFPAIVFANGAVGNCGAAITGENPARLLSREVMKRPRYVHVDPDRAVHVARALADARYGAFLIPTWDYTPYPDRSMPRMEAIRFLLVCDAINYRYVTDDGLAEYAGDGYKGAGLMVKRVADHWDTLRDPATLARLTDADVERIFAADVPLPAITERRKHLNEVGAYFLKHPEAGHDSWLEKHQTPVGLAMHLADAMPGFREPFIKRAQHFVGMVISRFRGEPGFPVAFTHAGELTVYADDVLPSILYRMGIVRYAPDLERRIRLGEPLEPDSREEVEIRAATVVAADELRKALLATSHFPELSVLELDFALWIQAKEIDVPDTEMPESAFVRPPLRYHRSPTTAY